MSLMDDAYCYYYKVRIVEYYSKRQRTYPAIAYAFDDVKFKDNKKLLLHVTADEHLYAGVVLYDQTKGDEVDDISPRDEEIIKSRIKVSNMDADCDFGYLPDLIGEDDLSDDVVPTSIHMKYLHFSRFRDNISCIPRIYVMRMAIAMQNSVLCCLYV